MYTIITKKLPAILSSLGHRYDYRNLPKKLNTLILAALICAPGLAFSVSTVVTVEADGKEATEAGPGTGSFTISRSNNGDIAGALEVPLVLSGTAEHGPDYTLATIIVSQTNCCFAVVIPAGLLSTTVTLIPIPDGEVEGDEIAEISLVAGDSYLLGEPSMASITIADLLDTIFRGGFEEQ